MLRAEIEEANGRKKRRVIFGVNPKSLPSGIMLDGNNCIILSVGKVELFDLRLFALSVRRSIAGALSLRPLVSPLPTCFLPPPLPSSSMLFLVSLFAQFRTCLSNRREALAQHMSGPVHFSFLLLSASPSASHVRDSTALHGR